MLRESILKTRESAENFLGEHEQNGSMRGSKETESKNR